MNPIGAARILVPTDFSESAYAALEYGVALARVVGARLSVLHVQADGQWWTRDASMSAGFADDPLTIDAHVRDVSGRLEQLMAPLSGHGPIACGFIRRGRADEQILAFAERDQSELIVMGSHGQTGAPVPFGRIAERVLREAPCPVLTIPSWTRQLQHVGTSWVVHRASMWAS